MPTLPRDHKYETDEFAISYDHAELTDDLEVKLFRVPANRRVRLLEALYINPTGLAEDTTNVIAISIRKTGPTAMAGPLSTDSDLSVPDASIVADTFTTIPLSATDAARIAPAESVISVLFDEGGAVTLPPGRLVLRLQYV